MSRWPARLPPPVIATETRERSFWQSRAGLRDAPHLTDLTALARAVRATTTADPPTPGAQEKADGMDAVGGPVDDATNGARAH